MRIPFRRTAALLLLLLAAVLAAPPASAAGSRNEIFGLAEAVSLSPLEFFDRLWSLLQAVWNGQDKPGPPSPPPAQTKAGCDIDPNGLCNPGTPSPPPAQTKDSCSIDPDGRCKQ